MRDEKTTSSALEKTESKNRGRARIPSFVWITVAVMFAISGTALGYRLGRDDSNVPAWLPASVAKMLNGTKIVSRGPPSGTIVYYRDPDGKPFYSGEPAKTSDGRDYVAVRASEDVSFDEPPATAGKIQNTASPRIIAYRNPMGLPDTSPVPKKDSMGMDYIPVYDGEVGDGSTVKISPGKLQRTGVRSENAMRRVVVRPVRVPGTVQVDERRVTVVSTRSDAFIDKVENVTTGDRVRKGQMLLQLYSPEIVIAAAQLMSSPGFEGSRRRLENLNVPAEVIAEIERTRKVPLSVGWSAPRDGVVLERNAIEGMKASAGDVLFRIADISVVWVIADVPERDLGAVRLGQTATIRVRSLAGRTFTGKINLIYPQVNKATRTTRVRIELPNADNVLLPDMYADVEIGTGATGPVLAVPESAVVDSGTRQLVILDMGDGRFQPREVKLGARGEGFVEIREGLAEGDRIVVAANFLIDAESNLKAALQGLTGGDQPK